MNTDLFTKMLAFLRQLERAKIAYQLRHSRDNALMVRINVPGERWEVEFLEDGEIEVERFRSDGEIEDETALQDLFARYSDADTPEGEAVKEHDAIARQ
ncbi:MAG TPA: hypothetical protein VEL76_43335 [Gemmataceae bacterium]|nr:hypothetical protein [Gemmataceae bacterium]